MKYTYNICANNKWVLMSDFVIKRKKEKIAKEKPVSFAQTIKKETILMVKLVVFLAAFLGLIYLSVSCNNLLLSEILVVGGILSLVFLIYILSNTKLEI